MVNGDLRLIRKRHTSYFHNAHELTRSALHPPVQVGEAFVEYNGQNLGDALSYATRHVSACGSCERWSKGIDHNSKGRRHVPRTGKRRGWSVKTDRTGFAQAG